MHLPNKNLHILVLHVTWGYLSMLFIFVVTKTQRVLFNVAIIIYGYLKRRMHNCSVKGIHNIWQIIGSLSFASVTKTFWISNVWNMETRLKDNLSSPLLGSDGKKLSFVLLLQLNVCFHRNCFRNSFYGHIWTDLWELNQYIPALTCA